MISTLFLWGILIGVAVAAPVGPVNIICLQRTLQSGALVGFVSGLGAAFGDSMFGFLAAFGVKAVSDFLLKHEFIYQTVGGLFLLGFAVHIWRAHPHLVMKQYPAGHLVRSMAGTFLLTVTNPLTILGFLAIYASAGLSDAGQSLAHASWLIAGVFAGSAFWWLILTTGARLLRGRLNDRHLLLVNRSSAVVVAIFGALALGRSWLA